jgi:hypothetical protein
VIPKRLATWVVSALLAACTASPSTPAATPHATDSGSLPPQGTPVRTLPPPSAPTSWVSGTIDQRYTTPALELRSTGTYVIWSTGARADRSADIAPDLFGLVPDGEPQLLYNNPNRDSRLEFIGGYGDRFAFVEDNARVFGVGGWRLWYLPGVGATPQVIDHDVGGQWPFFTMSDRFLVWSHGGESAAELRVLDLSTMDQRVLASASPGKMQFWFPHIDGTRLVYGTVEPNTDLTSNLGHIYYRDISSDRPALRLDGSESASEPAIHGDNVVWKESDPTMDLLNAGQLVRYSLATHVTEPLRMPTLGDLGFTEPTIGNRYVAAWPESDRLLYVADLQTGTFPPILDLGPTNDDPHDSVGHPDLAGDLLAYIYGPARGHLELRWVILR